MCCHWTMCQIIIGQCVQLSLDNVSNNHFNVRKDFFALAIICKKKLHKSHFVQPNVVCPAPAVPAVPTFCTPAQELGQHDGQTSHSGGKNQIHMSFGRISKTILLN